MTFRIYRYVTLNSAVCGAATAAIAAQIDIQAGTTGASGSLNDLCPATGNTKRVTVVVVADYPDTKTHLPVQSATLMADTATVQVAATGTGLRVNTTGLNSTGTSQTEPEKTYANAQNQTLYLYDTPCNQWNSHQPVNADHPQGTEHIVVP